MKMNEQVVKAETNETKAAVVEGFIDKKEVARRLGKKPRTVDSWMSQGVLPYYKIGGRSVSFIWSEVVAHLKQTCHINQ